MHIRNIKSTLMATAIGALLLTGCNNEDTEYVYVPSTVQKSLYGCIDTADMKKTRGTVEYNDGGTVIWAKNESIKLAFSLIDGSYASYEFAVDSVVPGGLKARFTGEVPVVASKLTYALSGGWNVNPVTHIAEKTLGGGVNQDSTSTLSLTSALVGYGFIDNEIAWADTNTMSDATSFNLAQASVLHHYYISNHADDTIQITGISVIGTSETFDCYGKATLDCTTANSNVEYSGSTGYTMAVNCKNAIVAKEKSMQFYGVTLPSFTFVNGTRSNPVTFAIKFKYKTMYAAAIEKNLAELLNSDYAADFASYSKGYVVGTATVSTTFKLARVFGSAGFEAGKRYIYKTGVISDDIMDNETYIYEALDDLGLADDLLAPASLNEKHEERELEAYCGGYYY